MSHRELLRHLVRVAPSVVHALAAALFAFCDPQLAIAATVAYTLYQYLDWASGSESAEETQLDMVEWLVGLALGAVTRLAASHLGLL